MINRNAQLRETIKNDSGDYYKAIPIRLIPTNRWTNKSSAFRTTTDGNFQRIKSNLVRIYKLINLERKRLTVLYTEKVLATGAFGRLIQAQAIGLRLEDESFETVAVRISPSKSNTKAVEVLVNEMKVLIHLATHLNVVRFLGACTTDISKGINIIGFK